MARRSPDRLTALLASRTPVTFPQLQAALGNASRATTFHYLRQVRYLRSYNHNGRFYSGHDPLRFDRHGLVSVGDVHFARDRTLGATVQRLVGESAAGCTHKALHALLHVPVHAFLRAAVRRRALRRERLAGVWVYCSRAPAHAAAQRRERQARCDPLAFAAAWDPTVVREVLLALVRDPGASPARLARQLPGHAPPIARPQVTAVLARFDLARVARQGRFGRLRLLGEPARPADGVPRALPPGAGPLTVDFPAEARRCPRCDGPLKTRKSQTRRVVTLLAGEIQAREIRQHCPRCPTAPVAVCAQLAELVPAGQRFGYDLIVWVGLARYHHHRQRREIRAELARRGILLSDGSVSALCDRFLRALEALHRSRAPALRAAMARWGYPLHIDATSDKGRGGLFVCLDGWRGWVLLAVKIASENAAELRPAIERTVAAFGAPVATMRDPGRAGAKAVGACRERAIPDLVCHYHFLAAAGQQLLDIEYAALRSELRRSKVRSGLRAGPARGPAGGCCGSWRAKGARTCGTPSPCPTGISTGAANSSGSRRGAGCRAPAPAPSGPCCARRRPCWPGCGRGAASPGPCRGWKAAGPSSAGYGRSCACGTTSCPAGSGAPRSRSAVPPPPRSACKPSSPRPRPTMPGCASGSPPSRRGAPAARTTARKRSCCGIRIGTGRACSGIPWPGTPPAASGRSWTAPTMSPSSFSPPASSSCGGAWAVRIACGSLDRLPQALAALDREALAKATPLQRNNQDAALRRRIRARAAEDG